MCLSEEEYIKSEKKKKEISRTIKIGCPECGWEMEIVRTTEKGYEENLKIEGEVLNDGASDRCQFCGEKIEVEESFSGPVDLSSVDTIDSIEKDVEK